MTEKLESGHIVEELKGEEAEKLKKDYFVFKDGIIKLTPGDCLLPITYKKVANQIYKFEIRPTDIVINTFPKSGTTWMQEIVWHLMHNQNLDNPLQCMSIDARAPDMLADIIIGLSGAPPPDQEGDTWKLFNFMCPGESYLNGAAIRLLSLSPNPRIIKNHGPLSILPPTLVKTGKVVYVARDPRDVIVSYYHFVKLHILFGHIGTLDDFIDDFINNRTVYGPYWEHVKLAWARRNNPNFLFLYYEDLVADAKSQIKKIDQFIGTNRSEKQLDNVVKNTSFSQMKEKAKYDQPTSNVGAYFNKDVEKKDGGFFRKGQVGDWKNKLNTKQVTRVNEWMRKNLVMFGKEFKIKV